MDRRLINLFRAIVFVLCFAVPRLQVFADEQVILQDYNGDGQVIIQAFGDSITSGLGDGLAPGMFVDDVANRFGIGGYPTRVATLTGVAVVNSGKPGEELLVSGLSRFASVVPASSADLVCILEGSNDAIRQVETADYRRAIQRMVNLARYTGKVAVLLSIPPPCCDHEGPGPFTTAYSASVREIAALNAVPFADIERAWRTTCQNRSECELYNLPEGLHPNSLGYDVIAQTVVAALFGIDIFAEEGALQLAEALGVDPASIVVRPGI